MFHPVSIPMSQFNSFKPLEWFKILGAPCMMLHVFRVVSKISVSRTGNIDPDDLCYGMRDFLSKVKQAAWHFWSRSCRLFYISPGGKRQCGCPRSTMALAHVAGHRQPLRRPVKIGCRDLSCRKESAGAVRVFIKVTTQCRAPWREILVRNQFEEESDGIALHSTLHVKHLQTLASLYIPRDETDRERGFGMSWYRIIFVNVHCCNAGELSGGTVFDWSMYITTSRR